MNHFKKIIVLVCLILWVAFFHSCRSKKIPEPQPVVSTQVLQIRIGESGFLPNGYQITFDSVVDDSRCPSGAQCIWEGDAEIRLTWTNNQQTIPFELHTNPQFRGDTIIQGMRISLINLEPYPTLDEDVITKNFIAEIVVKPHEI